MGRRPCEAHLADRLPDPLAEGRRRVVVTGAGGQLGQALVRAFATDDVVALTRADWDVTGPAPPEAEGADLILHAAAWTDVDSAERDPQGAAAVNVAGTANVAGLGAPVVYFSSDYVFDGSKRSPYLESDAPNPISAYGRTKLHGEAAAGERAWIVRTSWLFGATGKNFLRTMLELGRRRDYVDVVIDQQGCPTYVEHLARATRDIVRRPFGVRHVAASGDCSWADFAAAIFSAANLPCRVRPITTVDLERPARRPAYSVLRSELDDTPVLPLWRRGLDDCIRRIDHVY